MFSQQAVPYKPGGSDILLTPSPLGDLGLKDLANNGAKGRH